MHVPEMRKMKTIGLLAAVGWLAAASSAAEQPALIQNVPGRQTVDLCGPWRAIVVPYEAGYLDYRYRPFADGGMGANKKPKSPGEFTLTAASHDPDGVWHDW